jgi:hypothetical protein
MKRALATAVTTTVAAAIVTWTPVASAKPVDPTDAGYSALASLVVNGGRTDQQFYGESTWLNPLSGLNLDRTAVATQ